MRAFWTVVTAIQRDGIWQPNLPELPSLVINNSLDIYVLESASGATHAHLLLGGFAYASFNTTYSHVHAIITDSEGTYRNTYTLPLSQSYHEHTDAGRPKFFMSFVVCDDTDFAILTGSPYNVRIMVEAQIVEGLPGDLISIAWTSSERTYWDNLLKNNAGVQLPTEIDRGAYLVDWLVGALQARGRQEERALR